MWTCSCHMFIPTYTTTGIHTQPTRCPCSSPSGTVEFISMVNNTQVAAGIPLKASKLQFSSPKNIVQLAFNTACHSSLPYGSIKIKNIGWWCHVKSVLSLVDLGLKKTFDYLWARNTEICTIHTKHNTVKTVVLLNVWKQYSMIFSGGLISKYLYDFTTYKKRLLVKSLLIFLREYSIYVTINNSTLLKKIEPCTKHDRNVNGFTGCNGNFNVNCNGVYWFVVDSIMRYSWNNAQNTIQRNFTVVLLEKANGWQCFWWEPLEFQWWFLLGFYCMFFFSRVERVRHFLESWESLPYQNRPATLITDLQFLGGKFWKG